MAAIRLGWPIAIAPSLFYVYILLDERLGRALVLDSSIDMPFLITWVVNEAIFWVAAAGSLGWLLAYLPGPSAVLKGLVLAAVYAIAVGVGDLLVSGFHDNWTFRAFLLVLFYIALGIRLDLAALRAAGQGFDELVGDYKLKDVRGIVGYAAPAVLALAGIIQQLYFGDVQDAGRDIVSNLTTFIPEVADGR